MTLKPTITSHANGVTLEAPPEFVRMLLAEAKRSGMAQVSAPGVSSGFRSHWTGLMGQIDALLPAVAPQPVASDPLEGLLG